MITPDPWNWFSRTRSCKVFWVFRRKNQWRFSYLRASVSSHSELIWYCWMSRSFSQAYSKQWPLVSDHSALCELNRKIAATLVRKWYFSSTHNYIKICAIGYFIISYESWIWKMCLKRYEGNVNVCVCFKKKKVCEIILARKCWSYECLRLSKVYLHLVLYHIEWKPLPALFGLKPKRIYKIWYIFGLHLNQLLLWRIEIHTYFSDGLNHSTLL